LSVIFIKQRNSLVAMLLFFTLDKNYLNESCIFLRDLLSFQDPMSNGIGVDDTSEVRTISMFKSLKVGI